MTIFFFFNDTATTEIYTLSLHDALPISHVGRAGHDEEAVFRLAPYEVVHDLDRIGSRHFHGGESLDRKSTRLNSSHSQISYAVFCLKKTNPPPPGPASGPAAHWPPPAHR